MDPSIDLRLEAGAHAFGDGTHPTTAGVLAALKVFDPADFVPARACDMGAGSGILSFAIVGKFACPVIAVDSDRRAVETLRANAVRNGIAVRHPGLVPGSPEAGYSMCQEIPAQGRDDSFILPLQADGFDHPAICDVAPFDLITMNILAGPLLALAADAERHLARDGALVLSGMLVAQEDAIREAYAGLGLELTFRLVIADWVTQVWQKP